MSIEERDALEVGSPKKEAASEPSNRLSDAAQSEIFLNELNRGPNRDLAKPFGTPDWPALGALLAFSVAAIVFFADYINLGQTTVNWNLSFDVNLVSSLLILLAGAVLIGPKAAKNPRILRSQNTLSPLILILIVAAFFFFKVLDLGTFVYTLGKLDLGALVGLLCLGVIIALAVVRRNAIALLVLAGFFLWWGFSIKSFGFVTVVDLFTSENGGRLLRSMTPPRWDYFAKVIDPMMLTIQTAVASTIIGVIVALPLSMLAARNTTPHPIVYNLVRFMINTVRAVPSLVLALLFIPFVGLGPGAGVLGLAIHSISVLTKLYAEAFESVKTQPLEALNAVGANGFKTFRWGVFPQAFPLIASYSIFNWESNGRDSTVVAFVGGGGIGFLLQANLALLDYANVSVLLIVLILTVALLDRFSDFVRSKII